MNLELTDDEAAMIRSLLDAAMRDLRSEISHTDKTSFRRGLKDDEATIRGVLERLGGPLANPV
jgi:hypothetical protein